MNLSASTYDILRCVRLARFALSANFVVAGSLLLAPPFVRAEEHDRSPARHFDEHIAPVLIRRCLECHSGAEPKGGLDLSTKATAAKGGESGAAMVPGKPDESYLWQRVRDNEMPPKHPLPDGEKTALRQWIEAGAVWNAEALDPFRFTTERRAGYDWWALQPLAQTVPPVNRHAKRQRGGIDGFIEQKLHERGLAPSPEADRRTLIRRLSFDLLGLPPSPERVSAFVADERPDAYERLVDELLASPHYGVRWGRHWLDVARFGESQGFERDKLRENAWPYRDWVIDALNRDLPYDQFARLQLAGDVLAPDEPAAVIATGFLVAGPFDEVGKTQQSAAMKAVVRQDELEDLASVVGQTFLGLTVNCARCHDHKFDPIRQREYYQLTAALDGVQHGSRDVPPPDLLPPRATLTEGGKLSVYAVMPQPPATTHMLLRGNPASLGDAVAPGGVASLAGVNADFELPADAPDKERREKLAAWIADRGNPLFARVIVNRLWHYHFGTGLVDTPSDFGFNGGRPTHPELIDYLAGELIRGDWSLKSLQRRIVTSAAYRQASRYDRQAAAVDAENRLLWRMSPQRLDAESLRDAALSAAGQLNEQMGGPGFRDFTTFVRNTQFYEMQDPIGPEFNRRSVYRTWVRSGRSSYLDAFDCPDPSTKTPARAVTVTPLQALTLLNNSLVLRMSERFAERLEREAEGDAEQRVRRAYALAYAREPAAEELRVLLPFVERHGLAELCRVLLNSNEFLYVD
jgi:hypothetical protein